jgi:uncharacterized protein (DUF2384 family)
MASAYPATRYQPAPAADLSDKDERERLSPAALRGFFQMVERWKVRDEDARALLGGISNGPFYELKKKPERTLDSDKLLRISLLLGIFKALHILYSDELADRWLQLPNKNPLFEGKTPLDVMLRGGIPAMQTVRRLLDARRGGI